MVESEYEFNIIFLKFMFYFCLENRNISRNFRITWWGLNEKRNIKKSI